MAIQQLKKQSDLEKRLLILRKQVYGKESVMRVTQNTAQSTILSSDITYLYKDLLKILVFSSAALGIQLLLFFLMQNHIIKINF